MTKADKQLEALRAQKAKNRASAIATIIKETGDENAVINFNEKPKGFPSISTGAITIDSALGGGVPRGRIVEIYGPEASGKTTLCQHIIAESQRDGGFCAFIDVEHALDINYAQKIGVDTTKLHFAQPDSGEQALDIVETLIKSNGYDVIVIDSVAALVPQAELDGAMGDSSVGLQARLMSRALRKLQPILGKSDTCLIFTNQLRDKIGVTYGSPEVTTGGKALKFYASQRIDIRRIAKIEDSKGVMLGGRHKIKVAKNKVAPPHTVIEFEIMFGEGISTSGALLDFALKEGIITKRGSWFNYGEQSIGQGREQVRAKMIQDETFFKEIEDKCREIILANSKPAEEEDEELLKKEEQEVLALEK